MIDDDKVILVVSLMNLTVTSPYLINEYDIDSLIMKDEIFGPLLPILEYSSDADIYTIVSRYEKPLSLYVLRKIKYLQKRLFKTILWRRCVNDTIIHFLNKRLPFGGVGHGIGAYHGALSFDTFHIKSQ
jgi:aldehyde dehydrogenase (NAD+)